MFNLVLLNCAYAESISVFGRFCSPHVFSHYYTQILKSCRFFTLSNAFLHLRRKKAWDGKNTGTGTLPIAKTRNFAGTRKHEYLHVLAKLYSNNLIL